MYFDWCEYASRQERDYEMYRSKGRTVVVFAGDRYYVPHNMLQLFWACDLIPEVARNTAYLLSSASTYEEAADILNRELNRFAVNLPEEFPFLVRKRMIRQLVREIQERLPVKCSVCKLYELLKYTFEDAARDVHTAEILVKRGFEEWVPTEMLVELYRSGAVKLYHLRSRVPEEADKVPENILMELAREFSDPPLMVYLVKRDMIDVVEAAEMVEKTWGTSTVCNEFLVKLDREQIRKVLRRKIQLVRAGEVDRYSMWTPDGLPDSVLRAIAEELGLEKVPYVKEFIIERWDGKPIHLYNMDGAGFANVACTIDKILKGEYSVLDEKCRTIAPEILMSGGECETYIIPESDLVEYYEHCNIDATVHTRKLLLVVVDGITASEHTLHPEHSARSRA